jgi:3-phenylpropionate/cinnamic acid dioxygenase small subunit
MSGDFLRIASDLIYREAALIDQRKWAEWLKLFTTDVSYWIPCWDDDGMPTNDPQSEVSLVYYNSRRGLEDRIARITSGMSAASTILPRTCHQVMNNRIEKIEDDLMDVASVWTTHSYRYQETNTFYGFYEHRLRRDGEQWLICRKKIIVVNDLIPSLLDIYSV